MPESLPLVVKRGLFLNMQEVIPAESADKQIEPMINMQQDYCDQEVKREVRTSLCSFRVKRR